MVILFSISIFTGAFLLFLVQPLMAKMLLPYYGGAPAVWNTCMVFSQVMLLLGYACSHLLTKRFKSHFQFLIYFIILLSPLLVLPIDFDESAIPPAGHQTVFWLLRSLLFKVGLPFFVVASISPLLQRWFSYSDHPQSEDPYFLYSASNAGSLLSLISYPVLFEVLWDSTALSRLWRDGYIFLIILIFLCIIALGRCRVFRGHLSDAKQGSQIDPIAAPLSLKMVSFWVFASFAPSALMLSVTNHITTNLAAVPLLWVLPLSLYLLTFILAFARRQILPQRWVLRVLPFFILPIVPVVFISSKAELFLIPCHLIMFFILALACHTELAQSRPPKSRLTEFYLLMSVGGALGGVFVAIISPMLFSSIIEYPISLFLTLVVLTRFSIDSKENGKRIWDVISPIVLALAIVLFLTVSRVLGLKDGSIIQLLLVFGPTALIVFSFKERPWRYALAYGVLLIAVSVIARAGDDSQVYAGRNFFGTKHIVENEQRTIRYLRHGTTLHGAQYVDTTRKREPLSYYHRKGPIGEVFTALYKTKENLNVAVVGLGVGTIASYIREGSKITFFEIDSAVKDIAEDKRHFNFLSTISGKFEIIVGDGRLQLSKATDGIYDLIILDAFSSDSIPVHLLTSEAVALYKSKIKASGILVFHISNRFINLKPVLAKHAEAFGMKAVSKYDQNLSTESEKDRLPSDYGVMGTNDSKVIDRLQENGGWKDLAVDPTVAPWTDKYSNIIDVLKPIDLSIRFLGRKRN
jgi:hypothetical protein